MFSLGFTNSEVRKFNEMQSESWKKRIKCDFSRSIEDLKKQKLIQYMNSEIDDVRFIITTMMEGAISNLLKNKNAPQDGFDNLLGSRQF